jgi:hypothetical protein
MREMVTVYEPAIGDEVFIKVHVDPTCTYNPTGIPEPGTVIEVNLRKREIKVRNKHIYFGIFLFRNLRLINNILYFCRFTGW